MKLLFINAFKGLKKKKIQMLGIVLMVVLSTGIFSTMNIALDRMEKSYYEYLENQKVEYVSVDVNVKFDTDLKLEDLKKLRDTKLNKLTTEENGLIDTYECFLDERCKLENNPFETVAFNYQLYDIFLKYDSFDQVKASKLEKIKDKYNFVYEKELNKTTKEENTYLKLMLYNPSKELNVPYVVEGRMPKNNKEITILPKYAEHKNIKIGDSYKIDNTEYKVVGYAYAPEYIYPLVSYSALVFDEKKNNIIYMTNDDFFASSGTIEETYAIYYPDGVKREFEFGDSTKEPFKILNEEDTISMNPFTYTRMGRVNALQLNFATDRLFAEYFLYLLLGISTFVIAIVTKKRIEDEKLQIGVLKSLGYSPFSIAVSYLVYPIIGAVVGGLIGYSIGLTFNGLLTSNYISFYLVPLTKNVLSLKYLIYSVIVPMIVLSILSYIISIFMLRKKPLSLLKEGSNLKVNIFSKFINMITSFLPFKYRFKYTLAFRSIPKLIVVALTSFFTGLLIVLTLIGSNLMTNLVDESFKGMNYNYMVYMNSLETEQFDDNADYMLNAGLNISNIYDSNNKKKELKEVKAITITGIDDNAKFVEVLDENNKNISSSLNKKDGIIINKNMQEFYNIKLNDIIEFSLDEENKKTTLFNVVGISKGYMEMSAYVNRENLSNKIGYPHSVYSTIFSNNDDYSNLKNIDQEYVNKIATVLNFNDMKENISDSIEKYNASIYIVIGFASVIAFVIISVIANIVVEENKKTISLMKVMGYKNKKISSIVLNIYTPIIIISYLISIPVMIEILKKIVTVLSSSMEMVIPITLNPILALVGLICLLVAYYIAVFLSKRVLNKIPLAIALKRE